MNFSVSHAVSARGGQPLVYLDHNATTPLAARVVERVPAWLSLWGNPSSIHELGRGPKAALREARDKVAKLVGAQALEIIFTGSGSEGNNLVLKGVFEALADGHRKRFVFSEVEHPSIMRVAEALRARGADVVFVPVRRDGYLDLARFDELVDENTALVSIMFANNETGNIFPIAQLAERAHAKGALFHSDCVQALGKIPVDLKSLGVDYATFSGHKFYALKGAGFVYVKRGRPLESLIHGGGQERHRRAGTENTLAIASLGAMAELREEIGPRAVVVENLRNHFEARVLEEIRGIEITGASSPRIPNTSSLVVEGVDGETLLMNLDLRGFCVSTGAACSSGSPEPSPVLLAMGLSRQEAQSSLRVGVGWGTTREEVDDFVDVLKEVVAHVRSFQNRKRAPEKDGHVSIN